MNFKSAFLEAVEALHGSKAALEFGGSDYTSRLEKLTESAHGKFPFCLVMADNDDHAPRRFRRQFMDRDLRPIYYTQMGGYHILFVHRDCSNPVRKLKTLRMLCGPSVLLKITLFGASRV
jgi:hypothetical protein